MTNESKVFSNEQDFSEVEIIDIAIKVLRDSGKFNTFANPEDAIRNYIMYILESVTYEGGKFEYLKSVIDETTQS
jgi:hypothetical protein